MRLPILLTSAVLSLSAGAFGAGLASADTLDRTSTSICLDGSGHQKPVHCRGQDASRLNQQADICICPGATRQVTAPLCPPGVKAPPESMDYVQARLKAINNGSVVGATWHGQPMCVAPHSG
jgi:hypothetical protein